MCESLKLLEVPLQRTDGPAGARLSNGRVGQPKLTPVGTGRQRRTRQRVQERVKRSVTLALSFDSDHWDGIPELTMQSALDSVMDFLGDQSD